MPNASRTELDIANQKIDDARNDKHKSYLERF